MATSATTSQPADAPYDNSRPAATILSHLAFRALTILQTALQHSSVYRDQPPLIAEQKTMQTIRVAAVTMNSLWGKQEQTFCQITDFCKAAADRNVEREYDGRPHADPAPAS